MKLPYDTRADSTIAAQPFTLRGVADGAGSCTLRSGTVPQGRRWLINYVTVTTSGDAVPTLDLYVGEALLANILDGTDDATASVAAYNPPRVLSQGDALVAVWTGANAGAQCTARVEYEVEVA